jgi:hypothetical protein
LPARIAVPKSSNPQRVVGKNFFRDVARCTSVKAIEGRCTISSHRVKQSALRSRTSFPFRTARAMSTCGLFDVPAAQRFIIVIERQHALAAPALDAGYPEIGTPA